MSDEDPDEVTTGETVARELATWADPERVPVPDPGIEPHLPRLTDIDAAAADRATRQVAVMFALVAVLAVAFVVIYFAVPSTSAINFGFIHTYTQHFLLGMTLGFAILLIGLGAIQWARQLMVDAEIQQERHPLASGGADRAAVLEELEQGTAESRVTRRKVLGRSLVGALAVLVAPVLTLFADLGPWPTKKVRAATIEQTIWAKGIRLVNDVTYLPVKASDMQIGQLVNAEPENLKQLSGTEFMQAKAKAAIIIVRMDPNTIKIPDSRKDWQVGGILSYSKICTHVGCPISLWEDHTHHLLLSLIHI